MAKVRYTLTGEKDTLTGAALATMQVKVGKLTVTATKRIFTDVEQVGSLSDEDCLKMVNYAEDLFVRAKATSDNTPKGEKDAQRRAAIKVWKAEDSDALLEVIGADNQNALLDAYFAEHEEACRKVM